MRNRIVKRLLLTVAVLYAIGLVWGDLRLSWAAIKSLADYELIAQAPAVSFGKLGMSERQRRYLKHRLAESPTTVVPRVDVDVRWNAFVCARVESGHYVSPLGAERQDCVYVCLFGAWVRIYSFYRIMS